MKLKVPEAKRIRQYELTYLISVSLTVAEAKAVHSQVEDIVKKHKGSVTSKEDWGKKQMAYSIKHSGTKQTEAQYMHLVLEFDTSAVNAFEKEIGLTERIIRYLLVVQEKPKKDQEVATKE